MRAFPKFVLTSTVVSIAFGSTIFAGAQTTAVAPASGADRPAHEQINRSYRASELMGVNVQNSARESVGEIKDLVLDAASGRVRYVALSVGGFLGVGDRLFAVPYDALTFSAEVKPGDRDPVVSPTGRLHRVVGVLDVSKEHFKGDQGFDQEKWPNFADAAWRAANDEAFRSVRRRQLDRLEETAEKHSVRASQLIGLNIVNSSNDTVGEIDDLVLDDVSGNVRYAAVSIGGFLGMGTKLFAVPMSAFTITVDEDGKSTASLPVTKDSFRGIEGFDKEHWPNVADQKWRQLNDELYRNWGRGGASAQ